MDLDRLYKLGKTIAVFALSILLISATIKVWCGNCCDSNYKKSCAVSPCGKGSFDDSEVKVFYWDSDSGDFDIDAIMNDHSNDHEELLKSLDADVKVMVEKLISTPKNIAVEANGEKEIKKKVMVKVIGE